MKVVLKTLLLIFIFNLSFAGWQEARMINGSFPGGSVGYAITTDNFGVPWVVWQRGDFKFTKWNGEDWEEPRSVPPTIGAAGTYIDFIFDQDDKLLLIYPTQDRQNHCDIFSALYDPVSDTWELPQQVNDPDTTILDEYYPRIAIGGRGEIWATWSDEKWDSDSVRANVMSSYWNRELHRWEPEMTVNQESVAIQNRLDEFSDLAVDNNGIPHIVWNQYINISPYRSRLRYSKYENGRWTAPMYITNPDSIVPAGPYGGVRPKLMHDSQNTLHCVFQGYRPDSSPLILRTYYTKNEGTGWTAPVAFDTFSTSGSPVWECDIAVDRPDNIWVAWDRGGGSNWQIFVSHFDGSIWSPEERIDDGITYRGGFPRISLDGNGNPFVVWVADTTRSGHGYAVYYNRYISNAVAEEKEELPNFRFILSFNRIEIKYTLPHKDHIKVKVYDINGRIVCNLLDEFQEAGDHTLIWNRRIPQGVYFISLATSNKTYRAKTVIVR